MDTLGIAIIVISVLLAVIFKVVVLNRIHQWMDNDLINSLSAGDSALKAKLTSLNNALTSQKVKRNARHQQLEQAAKEHN